MYSLHEVLYKYKNQIIQYILITSLLFTSYWIQISPNVIQYNTKKTHRTVIKINKCVGEKYRNLSHHLL